MNFLRALAEQRLLFDGGMGTMLQAQGLSAEDCPELLNITQAAVITDIHAQYVCAGAQVVETNSLGLNAISLARYGLEDRLEELTSAAVRCARQGVGYSAFVALSVGPTGDLLDPLGTLTFERAYEAYRRQIVAGEQAGADVVYIETVSDIAEARIAILAAKEHTSLPVVCSFTYEPNGRTVMGGTPAIAEAAAHAVGTDIIASNCSGGPEQLLAVLRDTRAVSSMPVIIQPNAGLPAVVNGETIFPLDAEVFAQAMLLILQEGAAAVGGCCGTTPKHIECMRTFMASYRQPPGTPDIRGLPVLLSRRKRVFLDEALAGLYEIPGKADALYEIDINAAAVLIDVRELHADAITALTKEATAIVGVPLCFRVRDDEQASAAMRQCAGIVGIVGEASAEVLAHYGALRISP